MDKLVFAYVGRVDSVYNISDWEGRSLDCVDCDKPILEGEKIIGDKYKYEPEKDGTYQIIIDWSHSQCYIPWEPALAELLGSNED